MSQDLSVSYTPQFVSLVLTGNRADSRSYVREVDISDSNEHL